MEKLGFIVKFNDKAYEDKSIEELVKAPVSAISGISESDAADLKRAFGIDTVKEFANNKYVRIAQGINCVSDFSELSMDAVTGVSEGDAVLLKKAFGIENIKELAENKYVMIAQATVILSSLAQFLKGTPAT